MPVCFQPDTDGKKDPSLRPSSACHRLFVSDGLFAHLMLFSLYRRADAEERNILHLQSVHLVSADCDFFISFFFNQTFNNHSPCSRSYSSRQHFHGLIYPTAVLVHVAALSWTVLPALTSLCRGRPDAVLWWGSASECRLNTADLQPVRRELACFKDDLPKSFVKFRKLYH